jgi:AraC-like DNA-binding protein
MSSLKMQENVYGFYVPCSHVAILAAYSQQYSIDIEPILAKYNLSITGINTPNAMMTAGQYTELLSDVDSAIKEHDFWFCFAKQLGFASYGVLGQAMLSCHDLQQAIKLLVKYYQVLSCGSELTCDDVGDFLSINIYRQSAVESRGSIIRSELLVASIVNGMSALLPDQGKSLRFEFDYKKPHYHAIYHQYLNNNCVFSVKQSKLLIPTTYLKQACPHANPVMLKILTKQLDKLLADIQGPKYIAAQVRTLIAAIPGSYPKIEHVSKQMGISSRTLSRRLKDNNTNYQGLVNEVKHQRASNYLKTTMLSIEEIATLLGFNDSANFRRAFTIWTGMTPSQFRNENNDKIMVVE